MGKNNIFFPTDFKSIQSRVLKIDPITYAKTRDYLDGCSTHISPYLTHGVISTKEVAHTVLSRYNKTQSFTFICELAWREYFHMAWTHLKSMVDEDIQNNQEGVINKKMIKSIFMGETGINAIDNGIRDLYESNFIHHQQRQWIASLICNIGKTHWKIPSQWMYYNTLDGDVAINTLSWQMVAGTFGESKLYFNQSKINKYTQEVQQDTFLDYTIPELKRKNVPKVLQETIKELELKTVLPESEISEVDQNIPVLLYSIWSLKPNWHNHKSAQRILVLEPSHFNKYPISEKRVEFILNLAKNIPGIRIYVGEICNLRNINRCKDITSIQYPLTEHWPGRKEEREWIFQDLNKQFYDFEDFWAIAEDLYKSL